MSTIQDVRPGVYRHFKGRLYDVFGVAEHSESAEALVVYRPVDESQRLYARPLTGFIEVVVIDGEQRHRFEYVEVPADSR